MKVSVIPGRDLPENLAAAWRTHLEKDSRFSSPYFTPEFTMAVAAVRDDVHVAVLEDAGEIRGLFPFQRSLAGAGVPVGGALSDYHGVIGAAEYRMDPHELLRACGLTSFTYDHLLASQVLFPGPHVRLTDSPTIDLSGGFDAYRSTRRESGSREFTNLARKQRKMEREVGPVRFEFHTDAADVFRQMLAWKSEQYRASKTVDVFSIDWTVELLERIRHTNTPDFSGVLSALYAGDRLVAVHMGMRSRRDLHWWFPAYDDAYGKYSPGMLLLIETAKACEEIGFQTLDLGKGDEEYKDRLKTGSVALAEGRIELPSLANFARRLRIRAEHIVRKSPAFPVVRGLGRLVTRYERTRRFR